MKVTRDFGKMTFLPGFTSDIEEMIKTMMMITAAVVAAVKVKNIGDDYNHVLVQIQINLVQSFIDCKQKPNKTRKKNK